MSRIEGFGYPLVEAMACGCPVIGSDQPAIVEMAGDAASLVDPERPEAIAEAIGALAGDVRQRRLLSERGLEDALTVLAKGFPVPVQVTVAGDQVPTPVAVVAYFVCAEALANVAKHAVASRVAVSVTARDGLVRVEVEDDGVGGADPGRGSGLRGLADRVETVGGTLQVASVPGQGTRLAAEIPLGGEAW